MSSSPNSQNQSQSIHQNPPSALNWKPLILLSSAILTILLAFSLSSTNFSLPYPFTHTHLLQKLFSFLIPTHQPKEPHPFLSRPPCVLWMAPFLSPGGYSSEAWSYITSLTHTTTNNITLKIDHHGDLQSVEFWEGLPEMSKSLAYDLHSTECRLSETIVVCHSEPGAWYPPMYETLPCPPTGYRDPFLVVGRTMFETDRLTPAHARRCNRMDAVWVPTEFHVSTFVDSGVDRRKVAKLVQPVDVDFFDPSKHEKFVLPDFAGKEFVFLSVFKWEHRKGWDVLMKAFLEEFSKSDGVALYLLVSAFHSDTDFGAKVANFIEGIGIKEPTDGWARFHVIGTHVPQTDLPRIYKAADAFVLPSRGEGWGRPIVEAMSMALPVIATNWSGPTEYLTEENSYPLHVDRMSRVKEGPFKGHLWAEPSSERLRVLMRRVVSNQEEAREKGRRARKDMIERFSPNVVAQLLVDEIWKLWRSHGGGSAM